MSSYPDSPRPADSVSATMTAQEWSLLLFLSFLWGGSFFFSKVAVRDFDPLTLVALRVFLAALVLGVAALLLRLKMPRDKATVIDLFVLGFVNNAAPFAFIFFAQKTLPSGVASILNALTPMMTVIVAHFMTRDEKITGKKIFGIILGIVGVGILMGVDSLHPLNGQTLAMLSSIAATFCYGVGGVYALRLRHLSPLLLAYGQLATAAIVMIPLALIFEAPFSRAFPSWEGIWAMLGLAFIATALAYALYFRLIARAGATNLSLVTLLIPPSAIVLGAVFLGERLQFHHFTGMAFIALGLIAMDGRLISLIFRQTSLKK